VYEILEGAKDVDLVEEVVVPMEVETMVVWEDEETRPLEVVAEAMFVVVAVSIDVVLVVLVIRVDETEAVELELVGIMAPMEQSQYNWRPLSIATLETTYHW
jgi:hypothetical protein